MRDIGTAADVLREMIGAILPERNDEWAVMRSHDMTLETIAPLGDDPSIMLPTGAA